MGTVLQLAAAEAALANVAAARPNPASLSGPLKLEPTPIEVIEERLTFRCEEREGPICNFTAHYVLSNPTRDTQPLAAAFLGIATSEVIATIDGREAERIDDALVAAIDVPFAVTGTVTRYGFGAEIAASGHADLKVSGTIHPGLFFQPHGYVIGALRTRHMVLTDDTESTGYDLEYLISPIKTFARVGPIAVEIDVPREWYVDGQDYGWSLEETADRAVRRAAITKEAKELRIHLRMEAPFQIGGPLIGIGGNVKKEPSVRMRAGWQIAHPQWLLYSLVADTDFDEFVQITPTVEAALPLLLFIPSFSAGVGVPIQIFREVDVGIRFQATLSWPYLGVAFSYDLFFREGFGAFAVVATIGI